MPCYNSDKYISESIDSVLNQTYQNLELIIINDSSTDKTLEIIQSYDDSRIKIINSIANEGVAFSRNKGISVSNGTYIAFLDSDDIWEKTKLEKQLVYLQNGWLIVCSNYISFDKENIIKSRIAPEIIHYNDMLKTNFIGNLTGIYNQCKLGKHFQKKTGHEDYIMWLDIIKKSNQAYCIQEPLAKYRLSSNSLSGNKIKAMQWQWVIYRNELKMPLLKAIYYFSHYILNALKKRR
ncbi:TPA: glycosyltransferase family 2 protein [Providencia rettgeri]|nr:glycosyltransferase family 2 protein [Providencia rettgeri]HEM8141055.1 glycosyltransferase family 2 protein [Providencia rettgeri]